MQAQDKYIKREVFYLHREKDARYIAWLDRRANKSATIADILRQHIDQPEQSGAVIDPEAIAEAIVTHLAVEIRTTVQAAIESALAGLTFNPTIPPGGLDADDDEEDDDDFLTNLVG